MKIKRGQVAAITGAGSGIGRALAIELASLGVNLALADLCSKSLEATRTMTADLGIAVSTHVVDVAKQSEVEKFASDVIDAHGSIQLLFNNAGVTLVDSIEAAALDDMHWVMNVNYWGVVHGTKAFLPHLLAADAAHIVNLSSLFGLMAMPLQSAYCASKFAVRGFTEGLKFELAATNIGVSSVHPGGVQTDIARNARVRESVISRDRAEFNQQFENVAGVTARQAAAKILRGVEANRRRIRIGKDALIGDWLVRLFPASYEKILRLEKFQL